MVYVLVVYLIFKVHFTPLLYHIASFSANFRGIFLTAEDLAHIVQHLCFGCFGIAQDDLTAFNTDTFFLLCFVMFLLHISSPVCSYRSIDWKRDSVFPFSLLLYLTVGYYLISKSVPLVCSGFGWTDKTRNGRLGASRKSPL